MNPPSGRFTVRLAGQAAAHFQRLAALAEQRDLQPLLGEVVRLMIENLETRPREWGDPYSNYRGLGAVGYGKTIMAAGLRIGYAVHDTEPLVWVSSVRILPGSPFA